MCAEICLICVSCKGDVCKPLPRALSWSWPGCACSEGVCAVPSFRVRFTAIFHHSKGWGKGGRVKQPDSFGQYHFLAWLYSMRLMKSVGVLIRFSLKVILSSVSNMRQERVSTKGENKKSGGMSIHTSNIAIAGSLGMSKESKCLDERF